MIESDPELDQLLGNMVGDVNPVIFRLRPKELDITAEVIGSHLANDTADKQAAMLAWWSDAVAKYGPTDSWPQQCQFIVEHMSDEEIGWVRQMLLPLMEHLEEIPVERALKKRNLR